MDFLGLLLLYSVTANLYVAFSRIKKPQAIKILSAERHQFPEGAFTPNIVFNKVFE
jgi:hypothetical protein